MANQDQRNRLRQAYDNQAAQRDLYTMQDWKIAERAEFLALLQRARKQSLLEIGAGTGRDAKFFQDQGLETVCIDLSPANVELCRQKGLTAHVMDAADIQLPDGRFDAIYAMNSLLHLTKAELPAVLGHIDRLLKANGLVYIGVYGGFDHEGIWEDDSYTPKRFFSFFTDDQIQHTMSDYLDLLSFKRIDLDPGNDLHFQSLVLRKPPRNTHPVHPVYPG